MQEHQVTIGKQTFQVPEPFLVLATQNPIESDGTYPLPEAQLDRFMFKVLVDYPSLRGRAGRGPAHHRARDRAADRAHAGAAASSCSSAVDGVYVDPRVIAYAATLVTRTPQA